MSGKSGSQGFTKAAQKVKYVRNRDIKLKESELRKEENTKRLMSEGICDRCRDKVQWRFKYDKYKPLKNIGTCQSCRNKAVTKAYRSYCDACAVQKKACASCCVDMVTANREAKEAAAAKGGGGGGGGGGEEEGGGEEDEEKEEDVDMETGLTRVTTKEASSSNSNFEDTEDVQGDDEDDSATVMSTSESLMGGGGEGGLKTWGGEKVLKAALQVVNTKYSKQRVVGSEDQQQVFAFAKSEGEEDVMSEEA